MRTASRHALMIRSFNGMPSSDRRSFGCAWAKATIPDTLAAMTPAPMTQPCNITFLREIIMTGLLAFSDAKFDQIEERRPPYHLNMPAPPALKPAFEKITVVDCPLFWRKSRNGRNSILEGSDFI